MPSPADEIRHLTELLRSTSDLKARAAIRALIKEAEERLRREQPETR
ncbi:MAG TPA: hypothetical protein VGL83_17580 [Stellaceae bacterium]|jgi:hypothetical protein